MANITPAQKRFVDDMGRQMAAWGLPRTTGRVYAYLLLRPRPASLDEIAEDLGVAKSGVSVATRQLISAGLARSSGERGTRRLRFEALYDFGSIMAARTAQMLVFLQTLRAGAAVATAPVVKRKITDMVRTFDAVLGQAPRPSRAAQKGNDE